MAIFIPDWVKVLARHSPIKRVLNSLDDNHVVRRPIRPDACVADLFIEHRVMGWLAVAIEDAPSAEIDPAQLFESDRRKQFEYRLAELQTLGASPGQPGCPVESMVLMWACSAEEVRVLAKQQAGRSGVRLVSREQFIQLGSKLISGLLAPIREETAHWILGKYFPEAEIPAVCTTRRSFQRDNSAKLPRYFLDHQQEWASKLDLEMPLEQIGTATDFSVRLVNGVAGSGKTLIALNRAIMLAEMLPKQKMLMLIHNTPVVADLKYKVHRARGGLPANLEIRTFFSWANSQWRRIFDAKPNMINPPRLVTLIQQAQQDWPELKYTDTQLMTELDFINDTLIVDEKHYLEANRAGRGFALRPRERSQVWAVYSSVLNALRVLELRMWSSLPQEICLAKEAPVRLQKYHHVLVDEAQFFAPSWFHAVKLSLVPEGQLFLCADPNQGFMKNRLSWKSVGLDVAGRTKKLRWSYRTTRAILEAANSVLATFGRGDGEDYLEPDFGGMQPGTRPALIYTDSPQDSLDRVVNEAAESVTGGGVPLHAMLIVYGANIQKSALYDRLCARLGQDEVWWFNKDGQKDAPPSGYNKDYLRMAYLDSATGLEASIVILVGMEDLFYFGQIAGLNEEEQLERSEEQVRKLYMAMTRAGQTLILVSSQRLPEATERLFDLVAA